MAREAQLEQEVGGESEGLVDSALEYYDVQHPGKVPHRCTDVPWCFLMLLALALQGCLAFRSIRMFMDHDLPEIADWKGIPCGKQENENKPSVYWCFDKHQLHGVPHSEWARLFAESWKHPICVEDCPISRSTDHSCFNIFGSPDGSNSSHIPEEVLMPDYPSERHESICVPRDNERFAIWMIKHVDELNSTYESRLVNELLLELSTSSLVRGRWVLILACVLAVFTGWLYLRFLDHCAGCIVRCCAQFVVIAPLASGAYFMRESSNDGTILSRSNILGGASDFIVGLFLVCVGLILLFVVYRGWKNLKTAVALIKAGCECVFDEGTVMIEPFISSAARVLVVALMFPGMGCLILSGNVHGYEWEMWCFRYTAWQWAETCYYGFMMWWTLEYVNVSSYYILAWVTTHWYFTPYVDGCKRDAPWCAIFQGFSNLIRYHMGTVALGSLLIAVLRPLRLVCNMTSTSAAGSNPTSTCLHRCCWCCSDFCDHHMMFLSKNTYIDVAIRSTALCDAARNAGMMVEGYFNHIFMLTSMQFIFQVAGAGASTAVGTLFAYLALVHVPVYNDMSGPLYIMSKSLLVYFAAALSLLIGCAFMVVFDIVSDAMFYCYVIDDHYLNLEEAELESHWHCPGPSWFLGAEEEDEDLEKRHRCKRPVYAPYELREFMMAQSDNEGDE